MSGHFLFQADSQTTMFSRFPIYCDCKGGRGFDMSNTLAAMRPELIAEWSGRNYPLTPDRITFGSNKLVRWNGGSSYSGRRQAVLTKSRPAVQNGTFPAVGHDRGWPVRRRPPARGNPRAVCASVGKNRTPYSPSGTFRAFQAAAPPTPRRFP